MLHALKLPAVEYAGWGHPARSPYHQPVLLVSVLKGRSRLDRAATHSREVLVEHLHSTYLLRRTSPYTPDHVPAGGNGVRL